MRAVAPKATVGQMRSVAECKGDVDRPPTGRPAHCCADFEVARSRQADRLAKARLIETILELLHQDLETQFAGAVAGCDALDLELFIERRRNPLHFLHWTLPRDESHR